LTAFVTAFPRGVHAEEAIDRLKALSGPAPPGVQLEPLTPGVATPEAPGGVTLTVNGIPVPGETLATTTPQAPGVALTVTAPQAVPEGTEIPADPTRTTVASTGLVPAVPEMDEKELATLLQVELNRIGCNVGKPDGLWGRRSQGGLDRFAKETGRVASTLALGPPLLDLLKVQTEGTCPVVCSARENLVGNQCVLKTCSSGQRLSSKGICYVPVAQPQEVDEEEEEDGYAPRRKPRVTIEFDGPPASLCSLC
jgi:hypothetical protein